MIYKKYFKELKQADKNESHAFVQCTKVKISVTKTIFSVF